MLGPLTRTFAKAKVRPLPAGEKVKAPLTGRDNAPLSLHFARVRAVSVALADAAICCQFDAARVTDLLLV